MQELINTITNYIVSYLQVLGVPFGFLLIILESVIPALPLGVFIAFNMMAFGNIIGFILSWIATITGCVMSYFLFKNISSKKIGKKLDNNEQFKKIMKVVKKVSFSNLVLIIALPFSPAFLINIACGLAKTDFKKFISALLIGKISIVYFWGFVSKSLLESITDLKTVITILILLLVCYVLSKIVNKKLKIG